MKVSFSCRKMPRAMQSGHLKMGDSDLNGNRIDANSLYFTENGKPTLPIMGEFHFSRYNPSNWEAELVKMKSAGISVVATYFFWNHHEENEGEFNFDGRRNIRKFIETCQKLGLRVFIRPGPWAHGESRYGGFPDWLMAKGYNLRHNDERYLELVKRLYTAYYNELRGLFFFEGGPIIGMQLDNELQNDSDHLLKLKEIAVEIGFRVPVYTITGWGPGCLAPFPANEVIPVFGGYPEAPWTQHIFPLKPSPNYAFMDGRNDSCIGSDQLKSRTKDADESILEPYPFVTCELGPGVQPTYHRRPVIEPMDVYTTAITKLASGNNMPGYYVFHGGFNPVKYGVTYQESLESGYPNDLPVMSYDFQAPIGEFGFVKESYSYYRMLHSFINENREKLAVCQHFLADTRPNSYRDPYTPRFAVRAFADKENSYGYLFYTTYMRTYPMNPIKNACVEVNFPEERINLCDISIPQNKAGFFPLNFSFGGVKFKYITAQPVTVVESESEKTYFFAANEGIRVDAILSENVQLDVCRCEARDERSIKNITVSRNTSISFKDSDGIKHNIVFLPFEDALKLIHVKTDERDFAVISENPVFFDNKHAWLETQNEQSDTLLFYPKNVLPSSSEDGVFGELEYSAVDDSSLNLTITKRKPQIREENFFTKFLFSENSSECDEYELRVNPHIFDKAHDVRLMLEVQCDVMQVYVDDMLVHDFFNQGAPVEIGLKRFENAIREGKPLVFKLSKFTEDKKVYLERFIEFDKTSITVLKVNCVEQLKI